MVQVTLTNSFSDVYNNAIATARTCYSAKGIVNEEQVLQKPDLRDNIAQSIFQAGHHTVLQHAHFQFAIRGISRHALWSFFHSFSFYNSEQQSFRYTRVDTNNMHVPAFELGKSVEIYRDVLLKCGQAYDSLRDMLIPTVGEQYYKIFPARRSKPVYERELGKKAQEVARYIVPIAQQTDLYHTISLLTLIRYWNKRDFYECDREISSVVTQMKTEVCTLFPDLIQYFEQQSDTTTWCYNNSVSSQNRVRFEALLQGKNVRLITNLSELESLVDNAIEFVGMSEGHEQLDLLDMVLADPSLASTLNTSHLDPLLKCFQHVNITFAKKMSHVCDSQNQRHRASQRTPIPFSQSISSTPDYVVPTLLLHNEQALKLYDETMDYIWSGVDKLLDLGERLEDIAYILPGGTTVRLLETTNYLDLVHKHKMRLCYNAQEEIWDITNQEMQLVTKSSQVFGRYLQPPCSWRQDFQVRPRCPEGDRYCGVPVWTLDKTEYLRVI